MHVMGVPNMSHMLAVALAAFSGALEAYGVAASPDEIAAAREWVDRYLAADAAAPRSFSFQCDGKSSADLTPTWKATVAEDAADPEKVGDQPDRDGQSPHGVREHQTRKEIAHRVLLPVDEVLFGLDAQRVGVQRRAAMGRRAQPHDVRIHPDRPVKGVAGAVLQRDFDAHITLMLISR